MRNLFFIALFIFSQASYASQYTEAQIRSSQFEMEMQMSKDLESQIVKFLGVENIWLSVHLAVSKEKFEKNLREKSKTKRATDFGLVYDELPGVHFREDGKAVEFGDSEGKVIIDTQNMSIDPAILLGSLDGVDVTIYHRSKFDRKVERVIKSLLEDRLKALKYKVDIEFNYKKAKGLQDSQQLDTGKKVRIETDSFTQGISNGLTEVFNSSGTLSQFSSFKWLFAGLVVFSLLFMGFLMLQVVKSLRGISKGLDLLKNQFSSDSTHNGPIVYDDVEKTIEHSKGELKTSLNFESRIKEIDLHNSAKVLKYMNSQMDLKNFAQVSVLLNIDVKLTSEKNTFLKKHARYNDYVKFLSANTTDSTSDELMEVTYVGLTTYVNHPTAFVINLIKEHLTKIRFEELRDVVENLSDDLKGETLELLDGKTLGLLLNNGVIGVEHLMREPKLDLKHLEEIEREIQKKVNDKKFDSTLAKSLKLLNEEHFNQFIDRSHLGEDYYFLNLINKNLDSVKHVISASEATEIAFLFSQISEESKATLSTFVPELKLARVQAIKNSPGDVNFNLMERIHKAILPEELIRSVNNGFAVLPPPIADVA